MRMNYINTPQNKRYLEIADKIDAAFIFLLQGAQRKNISVTDIDKIADIERCTFYAYYEDVRVWHRNFCVY